MSSTNIVRGLLPERSVYRIYGPLMKNPFRYFKSSSKLIHLAVMIHTRYLLSLRQVEYLLYERGINGPCQALSHQLRGEKNTDDLNSADAQDG